MVEIGGHNPIEPHRQGSVIVTGPHTFNFEAMYQRLQAADACVSVVDASSLAQVWDRCLHDAEYDAQLTERAQTVLAASQGGVQRHVAQLIGLLERD